MRYLSIYFYVLKRFCKVSQQQQQQQQQEQEQQLLNL